MNKQSQHHPFSGDEPALSGSQGGAQPRTDDVRLGGDSALLHLIDSLNHSDPVVRKRAAFMLAARGDSRAYDALMRLYREGERSLQTSVLRALGRLGDPHAAIFLIAHMQDPTERQAVRIGAAEGLGMLGDFRAVEPLIHQLEGDSHNPKDVNQAVMQALINLGDVRAVPVILKVFAQRPYWMWSHRTLFRSALDFLQQTLDDDLTPHLLELAGERHRGAVFALQALRDPSSTQKLIALLGDSLHRKDEILGIELAKALYKLADPSSVEALLALLASIDVNAKPSLMSVTSPVQIIMETLAEIGDVRAVKPLIGMLGSYYYRPAGTALAKLQDAHAIDPLIAALRRARKAGSKVREIAYLHALAEFDDARTVQVMITSLKSQRESIRRVAISALCRAGTPATLSYVLDALHEESIEVRSTAFRCIQKRYQDDPRVPQALIQTLNDEVYWIRRDSAKLLGEHREVAAVDALIAALQDENEGVRQNARKALKRIGTPQAQAAIRATRHANE